MFRVVLHFADRYCLQSNLLQFMVNVGTCFFRVCLFSYPLCYPDGQ